MDANSGGFDWSSLLNSFGGSGGNGYAGTGAAKAASEAATYGSYNLNTGSDGKNSGLLLIGGFLLVALITVALIFRK